MAKTYTLISSVTVGSGGAANIQFTSILQTYTDLLLKYSIRGTASSLARDLLIQINSNSSSYSDRYLMGAGSTVSAESGAGGTTRLFGGVQNGNSSTANTFGNGEIYIPNYTSSNYKPASADSVSETNATTIYSTIVTSLWSNTAAISSLVLTLHSGNIGEYSTAYLYGISNA
jgi:hypothetical protein